MSDDKVARFSSISCHVFKDFGLIFDEKGSNYGTLRSVQWLKDGAEPDSSKAKLEIRKIFNNSGEEKMGKGYTFSTEEGPHELVEGLIHNGFGNTETILRELRQREDFGKSIDNIKNNASSEDNYDGEMFDIRSIMLNEDMDDAAAE